MTEGGAYTREAGRSAPKPHLETLIDVRWISRSGIEICEWADVPSLLERDDGFVWVDVLSCDSQKANALAERFGFHPLAVRDILERSHLPKIHAYPDHMFVVLHAPEPGEAGHIDLIQLGLFIGRRYLLTTHGPSAPNLIVVGVIAVVASFTGHVLLKRAQIRDHTQLERIKALHRRADADMAELTRVHHELEETSRLDPLTGAGNRIRLREDIQSARARMGRLGHSHGLVVIDLDQFKRVNDGFGHLVGDSVLKAVVTVIKDTIRAEDAVYRFGGEEFLVLLRLNTVDDLAIAAERIRQAVVGAGIAHPQNEPSNVVTISLGGVLVTPADLSQTDDEWFARADEALYRAKADGRNRSEVAA